MELRDLKKEVRDLPKVKDDLKQFKHNWFKPLKEKNISSMQSLPENIKKDVDQRLVIVQKLMGDIAQSQVIHDKLQQYSRNIVELKLTQLQNDPSKAKMITSRLLNDDFLRMEDTIQQVNALDTDLKELTQQYNIVNDLLHRELSLEETVFLMDLPHKKYLMNLVAIADNKKKIVRHLGRHFVKLAKQSPLKKAHS